MPCRLRPLIPPPPPPPTESQTRKSSLNSDYYYDMESPDLSASFRTQNSSATDFPSPITPNFPSRYHQLSTSSSSVDAMYQNGFKTSPSHDRFDSFGSGKCYLPDVAEESVEMDEDGQYDMFSSPEQYDDCICYECPQLKEVSSWSSVVVPSTIEYDLTDSFWSDGESSPRVKKRRTLESPFASIATRLSSKLPSFTKRWKSRRISVDTSATDNLRETVSAHAPGSRTSSLTGSVAYQSEWKSGMQLPPTPTRSLYEEERDVHRLASIDIRRANKDSPGNEGLATTPLLPPLTIPGSNSPWDTPVQSPLQSPTVAEPRESFSLVHTPVDTPNTPQLKDCSTVGRPLTPPLSTRPSISSFHRQRPGHLVPSNEIPPILIGESSNKWADKLGHANYNIHPEPYIPEVFDLAACKQLRANWDLARCNYTKHLVRTGEHYGVTSKTYRLTEEKWAEIDARWRRYDNMTISKTAAESGVNPNALSENAAIPMALMKIPSLNDPRSEGKFPKLGDEDIVGPMVQVASQLQRKPSKKATFMKFIQDVKFPSNVLRSPTAS